MANHNITLTATDKTRGTLKNVDKGLDRVTKRSLMFKGALGLAAGALAALGAVKVFKGVIDNMDNLAKRARNVGIQSEEGFAKFQVASRLLEEGGLEIAEIDRMFRNLTGRMAAGIAGNKQYAEIMEKIGKETLFANGELKEAPDLFMAVANAMQEGKIGMAEAQKILGEMVGPKVLGMMDALTAKGVPAGEAMAEVARSMNLIAFDDAKNAEKFNDSMNRLKESFNDLLTEAITPFLPAMTKFVEDLAAKAPALLQAFSDKLAEMQPFFDALGTVLNDVIVPVFGVFFDFLKQMVIVMQPIYEAALPLFQLALEGVQTVLQFVIDTIKSFEDEITSAIDSVTNFAKKIKENFGGIKDSVLGKTKEVTDGVKEAWWSTYDYLVGNSIIPEMKEAIIGEFEEMGKATTLTTRQTTESIKSDYDKLAEVLKQKTGEMKDANADFVGDFNKQFNDILADGLVEGNLNFDSFAGLWKSTLKDLISDTLNGGNKLNNILGQLGSMTGGGGFGGGFNLGSVVSGISSFGSDLFSGISSFFGGFFADGGKLSAGKFGVVGESGPELITGPATITPMNQMAGAGASVNITIQAIDTQTGTEFLLKNKKQVEGIIQNAFNRRGKQGIY